MFEKIGKWMDQVGMGHAVLAFGVPALVILLLALFAGCAGAEEANAENHRKDAWRRSGACRRS